MLLCETLKVHNKDDFQFYFGYFLPWKNQMVEDLIANGGIVTCFKANNNIELMARIWRVVSFVRRNQIQLIHAHLPWAGIQARIVGKIAGIPVVYSEHNKQERYHAVTRFMNLVTMNWQRAIIPVSNDVAQSLKRHKHLLKPAIRTILNGINTEDFDPTLFNSYDIRSKLNIPLDAPIIGTVAVFRVQKRLDLWIEIAKRILIENPQAHFIIVGDGPLREMLYKKRDEEGLKQRLHFPGLLTEVRPYLAAFDVYMMTSIFEGLPIALLEAMSMECAILSTDAGGIKEVIKHNVDGLLCPVDRPHQLIEYAANLFGDPLLRRSFGVRARQKVQESFSMRKMVGELEQLYLALAAPPSKDDDVQVV